ncbi:hypothetical protein AKJ16_DCAP08314 [Drosera capensis]
MAFAISVDGGVVECSISLWFENLRGLFMTKEVVGSSERSEIERVVAAHCGFGPFGYVPSGFFFPDPGILFPGCRGFFSRIGMSLVLIQPFIFHMDG